MQKANAAEIEKYIHAQNFPCHLAEIVDCAVEEGAPDTVVSFLERMPEREYADLKDVTSTINEIE